MSFAKVAQKNENLTRTTNGADAYKSTLNSCLDLYSTRFRNADENQISQMFQQAFRTNEDIAVRILLNLRDIRGGKGERAAFITLFNTLAQLNKSLARRVMSKIPEIGRWDDILFIEDEELRHEGYTLIGHALEQGNALCAKWMPRKVEKVSKFTRQRTLVLNRAVIELRKHLGYTAKGWRKTLVGLTQVVETQMSAGQWNEIEIEKVPSKAYANYRKAFMRHIPEKVEELLQKVESGEVQVNAGAVYPQDVIKGLYETYRWGQNRFKADIQERKMALAQWDALPDYMDDSRVLPMIDVSGSMTAEAASGVSCMDVALALGIYCAERNKGCFKDTFVTFTNDSRVMNLPTNDGEQSYNVFDKIDYIIRNGVGHNTNIESAFRSILDVAKRGKLAQSDMPEYLLVFSDMQFDSRWDVGGTALQMLEDAYKKAGYEIPKVIFWDIGNFGNKPTTAYKNGTALVSGFSPSILKAILSNSLEEFTPLNIMLKDLMIQRYDY